MLQDKRHAFWQAFFVAVLVFFLGLVFGVYLEQLRSDEVSSSFYNSEVSLYDSYAISNLINSGEVSCDELKNVSIQFADKIYDEAKVLEQYDEANKITDASISIHRKYDVLRTIYWINLIQLKKRCGDINTIVYLYDYQSEDVNQIADQITWSRILEDLKYRNGNNFVLIPIAADQNILSLDVLENTYGVKQFPAVIINEKTVLYDHKTSTEMESYLKSH